MVSPGENSGGLRIMAITGWSAAFLDAIDERKFRWTAPHTIFGQPSDQEASRLPLSHQVVQVASYVLSLVDDG